MKLDVLLSNNLDNPTRQMIKYILLALSVLALSSCGLAFDPVSITYTNHDLGVSVTEKVGDGKFAPSIDITEIHVGDDLSVYKQTDGSILIDHTSGK